MSAQVWWYATRAAGLMTWATATASVVTGLLLSTRALRARTGPWFLDLHRFLSGISVVFLVAHLITLWADSFVEFGLSDIFVPGAAAWKSEAIAWGIVAAYMLVAIQLTSLLRSRINGRVWRLVHLTSFLMMIAGSYHALTAGSDVDNPIVLIVAGLGSLLVIGLVSLRLQRKDRGPSGLPRSPDNRAILEEMRQRLADLPVPESTPQPEITDTPDSALPRRAPVAEGLFESFGAGDNSGPVIPTPSAIQAPTSSPASTTYSPPPLPTDIDPETGGPDEAAYTDWLKDWLVYAEAYGEDAPENPARV